MSANNPECAEEANMYDGPEEYDDYPGDPYEDEQKAHDEYLYVKSQFEAGSAEAELAGMSAGEDAELEMVELSNKLHATMDAKVWAEEFCKIAKVKPEIATDESTMIGWFANALITGYDWPKETNKNPEPEQKARLFNKDKKFPPCAN